MGNNLEDLNAPSPAKLLLPLKVSENCKLQHSVMKYDRSNKFDYFINISAIFSYGISFEKTLWRRGDSNLRRQLSVNSYAIHYSIP